mgnify:FL=1
MSLDQENTEKNRRRRRVNRLKKLILGSILCMIVIPVFCAVFLGIKVVSLKQQVEELSDRLRMYENGQVQDGTGKNTIAEMLGNPDSADGEAISDPETVSDHRSQQPLRENEETDDMISVYLTFDDGPSAETDRILDILKEYNVKATFFVIGKTDENSVKAYQRIVEEGHTLGMHSYSHQYAQVYASREAFEDDLTSLQDYLFSITGMESTFYRFPGGSSNKVSKIPMSDLIQCLEERNITYFDWNVSSGDASGTQLSSQTIINNVMSGINGTLKNYVVLFHDSAAKKTTVDALPEILEQLQAMEHTQILPITGDTDPVQHRVN